jgi:hypothetical protein
MTMMCGNCNQYGIHWVGPLGNLTGTKCPHCGGTNCHMPGEHEDQRDYVDDPFSDGGQFGMGA